MSDSVRLHRQQPTRLPCPWDSPGKNIGVDCHFLLQCMKVKSESEVIQSCPTLRNPMDCSLQGSSGHGIFQARVLSGVPLPSLLRQDTLLLYNPKDCRGEKKFVLSSSLRIPDPSLLGEKKSPRLLINLSRK